LLLRQNLINIKYTIKQKLKFKRSAQKKLIKRYEKMRRGLL